MSTEHPHTRHDDARQNDHQAHAAHGAHDAASNGSIRLESDTAKRMAGAATTFLALLSADQRRTAVYGVEDDERLNWHYVPKERNGLSFSDMDGAQRHLAHALLATGLSQQGYGKASSIMALERILGQVEGSDRTRPRDPDHYHVTIFGEPSDATPWGWRVEGHHVSVNMLVVPEAPGAPETNGAHRTRVASTPNFLGSNPARVPDGFPASGLRVLAAEEDLARRLLTSFDGDLLRRAVIAADAPSDILTSSERRVKPEDPAGVKAGDLSGNQRHLLMDLIEEYVHRMPFDVADSRLNRIEKDGTSHIHFAWAGDADSGKPHYYRLQAPSFLVEYDNTQNGANHIHSVWRDFTGDWGDDLLADHYKKDRHT